MLSMLDYIGDIIIVSKELRFRLLSSCTDEDYKPGEVIIEPHAKENDLLYIERGLVKLGYPSTAENFYDSNCWLLVPQGRFYIPTGGFGIIDIEHYAATSLSNTTVTRIKRSDVNEIMREFPEFKELLFTLQTEETFWNDQVNLLAELPYPEDRLKLLWHYYPDIVRAMRRDDLASFIKSDEEDVEKILYDLAINK